MKIKQMVYGERKEIPEVLCEGRYKNHKFVILNLGTHPAAYVEDKIGIKSYYDFRFSKVYVHGGFSFNDVGYWGKNSEKQKWVGWDYTHSGDFKGAYPEINLFFKPKKWTTAEIYEQVKRAINKIIEAEQYAKTEEAQCIQAMLEDCKHSYYDYSQAKEICRVLYQKGYRRTEKEIEEERK